MTTYVILGHGGFDPESDRYPKETLVPQDTTLKFWSEAGQALTLPATGGNTNYAKVAPAFNQLKEAQPSLGPTKSTYNYALYPEDHEAEKQGARAADWQGAQLIMVDSGKRFLCQDTEGKCPTPDLLNSTDESVLTDPQRWIHHCDGILGEYGGGNNEINWVACTSFEIEIQELPAMTTVSATGPGFKDNKDWEPDDEALEEASALNKRNIKSTDGGKTIGVVVGGKMVLIGEGHDNDHGDYVRRQPDLEEGEIEVTKSSIFTKGKGTLELRGIKVAAHRNQIRDMLNEFSEKDVIFGE
jgi:hypothetical protein